MLTHGFVPHKHVFTSVVKACSSMGSAFVEGVAVHAQIIISGFGCDPFVGSALIGMYSGCGYLRAARGVFDGITEKDTATRTAMLSGYVGNGDVEGAWEVFDPMPTRDVVAWNARMIKLGLQPDRITFMGVLMGCSHAGMVDDGWRCLLIMRRMYKIEPRAEHYGCMFDILSRRGYLVEAHNLLVRMSFAPDIFVLGALLHGCLIHGYHKMGLHIAEEIIELVPEDKGRYVTLSNLLLMLGNREAAFGVRRWMEDSEVTRSSGSSTIEIDGSVHEFIAGDRYHCRTAEIYWMINLIRDSLRPSEYFLPQSM
ncbi:hypothetical protein EJ110_NYTH05200 [Nymphaea thermarum]|nr:hypothetical protein EJ110_NYTH05200 [Nymphaea thermarum]